VTWVTALRIDQATRALAAWDGNPVAQRRHSETDLLVWVFCIDRDTAHQMVLIARKRMEHREQQKQEQQRRTA
jgi:hypothetical protein